eukprot:IDg23530t1
MVAGSVAASFWYPRAFLCLDRFGDEEVYYTASQSCCERWFCRGSDCPSPFLCPFAECSSLCVLFAVPVSVSRVEVSHYYGGTSGAASDGVHRLFEVGLAAGWGEVT